MSLKLVKSRSMWRVHGFVGRGESTVNDDDDAQCVVIVLLSFSCPILFKHTLSILCEKNINGYLVSSIHRKSAKVTVSSFGLFWCEPARVAFTSVCVAQLDFNVKFDKHPAAFS